MTLVHLLRAFRVYFKITSEIDINLWRWTINPKILGVWKCGHAATLCFRAQKKRCDFSIQNVSAKLAAITAKLAIFTSQENSRKLWRSQRRKSRSFPEGGADFPAATSLVENAQTLAGIAFRAGGKSVKSFPAALKSAGKLFQQGISDSSLLEFSDKDRRPLWPADARSLLQEGLNFLDFSRIPWGGLLVSPDRVLGGRWSWQRTPPY